jgi:hypothetical protein
MGAEELPQISVVDAVVNSVEQESIWFHPKQNFHLG